MSEVMANVHIKRGLAGEEGKWVAYQVPLVTDMTVLGVLDYIYEHIDTSLAYYQSCRFGRCKGCFVTVDGKTVLSCDHPAHDGMRVEPVAKFVLIKDLVVDLQQVK
jgi:succinate dehydrogenase/fumarate reductase-like Fe-S protein